jgi:hypothetical protein
MDFICRDRKHADLATSFLTRGVLQKWHRRAHRPQLYSNTRYWKKDRKSPRNIALYGDRKSKTGLGSCSHFELRFTGAAACKRAGVGELLDLIAGIDPLKLLNRQARISCIDPKRLDRAIDRIARCNLRHDQRRRRRPIFQLELKVMNTRECRIRTRSSKAWGCGNSKFGRLQCHQEMK